MVVESMFVLVLFSCPCLLQAGQYFAVIKPEVNETAIIKQSPLIENLYVCAKQCEKDHDCKSFGYNEETQICKIYSGGLKSGPHSIENSYKWLQKSSEDVNCVQASSRKINASCESYNGEIWTVIQKRFDGSQSFDKNWTQYRDGFGSTNGEYWIGNSALHILTETQPQKLMVVLEDWSGLEKYAEYGRFHVASESDGFMITVDQYSGTAGDSLSHISGIKFSTSDVDNDRSKDRNCAEELRSGWWFKNCHMNNLNGQCLIYQGCQSTHGITWFSFHQEYRPLKKSRMMIKPRENCST